MPFLFFPTGQRTSLLSYSSIKKRSISVNISVCFFVPSGVFEVNLPLELISLATETERTLFFDFLPIALGDIKGFKIRFHLYTVPGQVFYAASRKLILKGVDGVVFVADSQIERMESNMESLDDLQINLAEQGYELEKLPFAIQYNKRDLPNIVPIEEMDKLLNHRTVPWFEGIATNGNGVFETLKAVAKLVLFELKKHY